MALQECTIRDFLRGGRGNVTIRFDGSDSVKLPCHCEYDPALCGKDGNEVMVVRKIEKKSKIQAPINNIDPQIVKSSLVVQA